MIFNVGKLVCLLLLLAHVGMVSAQDVAYGSEGVSASVSVTSTSLRQFYVAPTGRDSNDGSAAHPWATIAHAATLIAAGATVHVAPGTYTGYITTHTSGTSSARITYISDVQWGAKIVGNQVDHSTWHNYGNYVDIMGFELTSVGRIGLYNDGSFVRYIGNHVHDIAGPTSATCDLGGAGIMHGNYSASNDEMIGNFVHDIGLVNSAQCAGYVTVHGLYHANQRGRIVNNLVIHARDYGIHLYHSASAVVVANNTALENGASGLVVGNSGGGSDNNTVVTNNLFAYNQDYGFRDDSGTTGPNNKYDNNLTFNNGYGTYVVDGGTVNGNISTDPKFTNYTGTSLGNYKLQAGSPAIDSGTTLNAPTIDLDGGPRPVGKGYDIGCYEYGATRRTWPWH
jgi:parallel beta-helix repeat protein